MVAWLRVEERLENWTPGTTRKGSREGSWLSGGFPSGSECKESACNAGDPGSIPRSERFPWRRKWQPTPVFLAWKNPMDREAWQATVYGATKELDTTEQLNNSNSTFKNLTRYF